MCSFIFFTYTIRTILIYIVYVKSNYVDEYVILIQQAFEKNVCSSFIQVYFDPFKGFVFMLFAWSIKNKLFSLHNSLNRRWTSTRFFLNWPF